MLGTGLEESEGWKVLAVLGIHEETLPPAHTLLGVLLTWATSFHTHQFLSSILLKPAHSYYNSFFGILL